MKIISLISLLFIIFSCQKEELNTFEERTLAVTIFNPNEGDEVQHEKELTIQGEIIGNFELHGYSIELINTSNADSVLLNINAHKHGKTIPFSTSWKNKLSVDSDLALIVTGYGDHAGYLSEKTEVKLTAKGN